MTDSTQAAAFLSIIALCACSVDSNTVLPTDADVTPAIDAIPPRECTVINESYPDLGSVTGTASLNYDDPEDPTSEQYLSLQFPLNTESPPDVLFVELYLQSAPFDEGSAPYTINLLGDQADLVRCGACTYIAADFVEGELKDFNMAYNGELVLSALDPTPDTGKVTGTLKDVLLHDVDFSENGQTTVSNGCLSTIEALAFDFDVGPAPVTP